MNIFSVISNLVLAALLPLCAVDILSSHKIPNPDDGKCQLISTFSLITQASLGLLCLSCLIVKRFYEYPLRRTWPVWLFDVLKQLIGAMGLHVCNVFLSILKGQKQTNVFADDPTNGGGASDGEDPCDWYFLNIVFDCTIGVFVLYIIFGYVNKFLKEKLHVTHIESGEYGPDPNKPSFRAYFKQLAVYFGSLMATKVVLYYFMELFADQLLWFTSHVLLVWLNEYPDEFEIFVVMFVVPIFMNCLQLILVDTIIQNQLLIQTNTRLHHEHCDHVPVDEHDRSKVGDTYGTFENEEV